VAIMYDPQTSGGLLVAASQDSADRVAAALAAALVPAVRIGSVGAARPGTQIVVRP
jgi:selenophosphate synthase